MGGVTQAALEANLVYGQEVLGAGKYWDDIILSHQRVYLGHRRVVLCGGVGSGDGGSGGRPLQSHQVQPSRIHWSVGSRRGGELSRSGGTARGWA